MQHYAYAETTPLPEGFSAIKADAEKKLKEGSLSNCYENLVTSYDLELVQFMKFLEGNFQNKSATSSLVNIAISRYSEFKTKLESLFATLNSVASTGTSNDELTAYVGCAKIKDVYIELAKEKMIEYIKNNQSQKRSSIMVEKYKAINGKLNKLNIEIAKMYSYYMTFKEKLPWFTRECVRI